jgi:hypothetical protein
MRPSVTFVIYSDKDIAFSTAQISAVIFGPENGNFEEDFERRLVHPARLERATP